MSFITTRKAEMAESLSGMLGGPSLDLNFLGGVLDPRIVFTRAGLYGTATHFDSAGVLQNARVNIALQSADMVLSWVPSAAVVAVPTAVATAALAPDGTNTAIRVVYPQVVGAGAVSHVRYGATAVASLYTMSVYLKGNVGGEQVYIYTYDVAPNYTRTLCTLTTEWQRYSVTSTLTAASWNFAIGVDLRDASQSTKAAQTIYAWGGQVEQGSTASPYIATAGAANGAPRFDFDPTTARTNAVRNSTLVGTAPGTPGTLPTNWTYSGPVGVAITVGTATTVDGIVVLPITFAGTASTATSLNIVCEANATAAAGETWSASVFMALATGAPLRSSRLELDELTSGGGFLAGTQVNITPTTTLQRFSQSRTFNQPTCGRARFICAQFEIAISDVVNFTIYLGAPQMEIGPAASHYIPTSGVAASGNALAKGLLMEETRTNSIRNTTMVGAVAGTPGTPPTNWTIAAAGVTIQLVGTGTTNGLPYIDYRISGTTTGVFGQITLDAATAIAALNGQVWATSWWVAVVAGSLTNVTSMSGSLNMRDAGGVSLASVTGIANFVGSVTSTLTRISGSGTLTNASTAFLMPIFGFGWSSGVAIDFTIRIAGVQLELGAFATSFIPTSTAAVARGSEHALIQGGSWLRQDAGTLLSEVTLEGLAGNAFVATINDGTNQNEIRHLGSVGGFMNGAILASNTTKYSQTSGAIFTVGPINKTAIAYTDSSAKTAVNGALLSGGTAMTPPLPVVDRMQIMSRTPAVFTTNGWLRRIRYWPRMMPEGELRMNTQ